MKKLILDLCGGTGGWSRPYAEHPDYEVWVIDTQEWLNGQGATGDVRLMQHLGKRRPYGILAAPPCTDFSSSGARWWAEKGEAALLNALSVADACARIILFHKPERFWAWENPVGRLRNYIGDPTLIFNPCDYGDPYTKKTLIWGDFIVPPKTPVEPTEGSKMHLLSPGPERARLRSATPPGWSTAFFNSNP